MTDKGTVRMVVGFLGAAVLIGLIGLIWLVGKTDVRDAATLAIIAGPTGVALGSLGTMLASTRTVAEPPPAAPVAVVGPSGGPVETVDVDRPDPVVPESGRSRRS